MKKVLLLASDGLLKQKIHLALYDRAEVSETDGDGAELLIREGDGCIYVGERRLSLPLSLSELWEAVEDGESERLLSLDGESKSAILGGEIIKLTEVEYRLLAALASARGDFVSRRRLLAEVWGEGASGGILNVYIHYLRDKLEGRGEKLILSSRTEGYKIDGRYLNADNN